MSSCGRRCSAQSHKSSTTPDTDRLARIHTILVYAPARLVHPHHSRAPPSASQTKLTTTGVFPHPARLVNPLVCGGCAECADPSFRSRFGEPGPFPYCHSASQALDALNRGATTNLAMNEIVVELDGFTRKFGLCRFHG